MDTINITELKSMPMFRQFTDAELSACLEHLSVTKKSYRKDELILHAGGKTRQMGIVLSGSVTIENSDAWGNVSILSHVAEKGFFAETYALEGTVMLVDVQANEDCTILFLDISAVRGDRFSGQSWYLKLLRSLLSITAHKNLVLSGRSFHTAHRTIRRRILSYLTSVSLQKGKREFNIPFDRQQLADYLNVERTALSKELGKMKKENLIDYRKNHFRLL